MTKKLTARCEFINICSDIRKLRESEARGAVDEELDEQHHKLCTNFPTKYGCLLYREYAKQKVTGS